MKPQTKRSPEPKLISPLPQNIEAEQAVLGAILVDSEAIHKITDVLLPTHFYRENHRLIYDAMLDMADDGELIDIVSLTERMREKGILEKIGGATYLSTLAGASMTGAYIVQHASILREMSFRRNIVDGSVRIDAMARDITEPIGDTSDKIQQLLFSMSDDQFRNRDHSISSAMRETLKSIESAYIHKGSVTGLKTGLDDVDQLLCGLQPSDLIIIAARPSLGKTSLALQILRNITFDFHIPAGIFSLEMSREQLGIRLACMESRISGDRVRKGQITEDEMGLLTHTCSKIADLPLYIDDTAAMTPLEVRSIARRWVIEKGVKLIAVDHLQLMKLGKRAENRNLEIGEITQSLKAMAKELKIPVIALSQLSRKVEERADKRPILSDLRDSGSLEQDADVIAFIYRDECYNKNSPDKGKAELLIRKNRNGPTACVDIAFIAHLMRFENLSPRSDMDYHRSAANDGEY